MSSILTEGTKLRTIFWSEGSISLGDKPHNAKSIVVTMEYGQMAGVPWARVDTNEGKVYLYNLAEAQGVQLLDADENEVF